MEPCPPVPPSRDVTEMPGLARAQQFLGPIEFHTGQFPYMLTEITYPPPVMGACSLLGWQIFFLKYPFLFARSLY